MTDLVMICDWLPPDFGAVGQYADLSARQAAEAGRHVVLIGLASSAASDTTEQIGAGSLRTIKLAAAPYDKRRIVSRLIWTARINTRLLLAAWPHMQAARRVQFTGSPPLFLHWIGPANLILRRQLVYRITDFHPECAMAARGSPGLALSLLYRATLFWRRRIDRFEVLGHDQAERLRALAIPDERIELRPDPSPVAIPQGTAPLPRPAGTNGNLLLLYSGNWGVAHDWHTFAEAYTAHHRSGSGRIMLWLNAVGVGADTIAAHLAGGHVPFVRGHPVPLDQLPSLLVTPDAHLITLSDAFVGYVLPSKVHGCLTSRRPVLFVGSASSDVHRICARDDRLTYVRVDAGDVAGCARALETLADALCTPVPPAPAMSPAMSF